ncbi:MAG: DUF2752 domain-containing protein [Armatimonadota bacterium]|nr:DUF2752 domain-containing protein [Armatimonadota bacterium]
MLKKLASVASFPVLIVAAKFFPYEHMPGICVFYKLTGYPCPTCGMTRSVIALTRLDFHKAFAYNALAPLLIAAFGVWWGNLVYKTVYGRRTWLDDWFSRHLNILVVLGFVVLLTWDMLRILLM